MSLINPTLLYALPLVFIPVLLHLLLRSKPKRIVFPALQLIQSRRKSNVSKMRLKQFWLMLLRVLVIGVLIAAIARPSFPAANYEPNWYEIVATLLIGLGCIVAYKLVVRRWKQQQLARHLLSYKQTWLRSVMVFLSAGLFLLFVLIPYGYRLREELSSPQTLVTENIPTAAVLIFDCSLSMEYRKDSQTRLDVAREIAAPQMEQFPTGSRVAVVDNRDRTPVLFQIDQSSAKKQMFEMELTARTVPLNLRVLDAMAYQQAERERLAATTGEAAEDRFVREVYIFTDLSETAWDLSGDEYLRGELEKLEYLQIYLIDVGQAEPDNFVLNNLEFENEAVLEGEPVEIQVSVYSEKQTGVTHQLELYLDNEEGEPVKRSSQDVLFASNEPMLVPVAFEVPSAPGKPIQGELRLASNDAMTFDNVRYFTIEQKPVPEVLIVSDDISDNSAAVVWRDFLAPEGVDQFYRCTMTTPDDFVRSRIKNYDNICLINVLSPNGKFWEKLQGYVAQGGGLFVVLGSPQLDQVAYNNEDALQVMPVELNGHVTMKPEETIDFTPAENHPMLEPVFTKYGDLGDLGSAIVDRCWSVKPTSNSGVVARFTSPLEYPALVERIVGRGRVMLLTTAIDFGNWSELARADWMIVLADQLMQYTAGGTQVPLNYTSNEGIVLPLGAEAKFKETLLRLPDLTQIREKVDPDRKLVLINNPEELGHYELLAVTTPVKQVRAFSLNVSNRESDLEKLSTEELDALFGEERYQVASSTEELTRQIGLGRVGQEMFPLIMVLLLILFWGEHLVANRFYEQEQEVPKTG